MFALPSLPGMVLMRSSQLLPKDSLLHLRETRGQNVRICLPSLISGTLHKGATSLYSPAVSADLVSTIGTLLYLWLSVQTPVRAVLKDVHTCTQHVPTRCSSLTTGKTAMLFCLVVMVLDKYFQPAI